MCLGVSNTKKARNYGVFAETPFETPKMQGVSIRNLFRFLRVLVLLEESVLRTGFVHRKALC